MALNTNKLRLALAILFVAMPATRTGAASVAWVNGDYLNPRHLRFVLDKPSQLIESPFTEAFPLRSRNRYFEAAQVLNSKSLQSAFGFLYKAFGNGVVTVPFEAAFSTRQLFQMAFGRFCSCGLQGFFEPCGFFSDPINGSPTKGFAGRIGCQVDYSEINPKITNRRESSAIRQFDNQTEKELTFAIDEVGLLENAALFKFGILTKDDRNFSPAINCENRGDREIAKRQQAVIVDDCRKLLEFVPSLAIGSVGFADLANGSDRKLRRQADTLSNLVIGQMVQINLSELLIFKGNFRDVVTSVVEMLHRLEKRLFLISSRQQFHVNSKFHRMDKLYHLYNLSASINDHQ